MSELVRILFEKSIIEDRCYKKIRDNRLILIRKNDSVQDDNIDENNTIYHMQKERRFINSRNNK